MNLFGLEISLARKASGLSIDELVRRLELVHQTASSITVTPENCEEAPTVQAIVNAITSRIITFRVHVFRKTMSNGRASKELLPNHPVARLLQRPNGWQTEASYWLDSISRLVRYGRHFAFKARGMTGPIRRLEPLHPGNVELEQLDDLSVVAHVKQANGGLRDYSLDELHYVRGRASDGLNGDSPVVRAREAIALEMAAQRFGAQFFGNGAMPGLVFKYAQGFKGHQTNEARQQFIEDFHAKYGNRSGRWKALLLPNGIDLADPVKVENDKAQFIQARKTQRNIIAGVFGVPPHLVGDLENGTLNNVEQQSRDFEEKVMQPIVQIFESAMERDLLTEDDRRQGVIIRFNMNAGKRASFKEQQEGLKIQREAGVINPNEWREHLGMNPREGGDEYWDQGPSGQGAAPPAPPPPEPEDDEDDDDED